MKNKKVVLPIIISVVAAVIVAVVVLLKHKGKYQRYCLEDWATETLAVVELGKKTADGNREGEIVERAYGASEVEADITKEITALIDVNENGEIVKEIRKCVPVRAIYYGNDMNPRKLRDGKYYIVRSALKV